MEIKSGRNEVFLRPQFGKALFRLTERHAQFGLKSNLFLFFFQKVYLSKWTNICNILYLQDIAERAANSSEASGLSPVDEQRVKRHSSRNCNQRSGIVSANESSKLFFRWPSFKFSITFSSLLPKTSYSHSSCLNKKSRGALFFYKSEYSVCHSPLAWILCSLINPVLV